MITNAITQATTTIATSLFIRQPSENSGEIPTASTTNGKSKKRSSRKEDLNPFLVQVLSKAYNHKLARIEANSNGEEEKTTNKEEKKIKFIPYRHPTPGKTIVRTKEKVGRKESFFGVEYNEELIPKVNEVPRAQIKLPGIEEEKINKTKLIAKAITNKRLQLNPSSTRIKLDEFKELFEDAVNPDDKNNIELLALTGYFCLKKNSGFLSKLPDGLINEEEQNFPDVVNVLGRYFFVNLNKTDTAEKIEQLGDFAKKLPEAGLATLYSLLSPSDLIKVCYPGYLDGPDPPIREWLLPGGNKWQLDEKLLERACKYIFLHEGVLNNDGTINKEEVLKKEWSQIFNDPKNGIRGALAEGQYVKGALGALNLAAPGLIGIREDQIPRWRFPNLVKITSREEGDELIDEITTYLVEEKLKLFDEHGNVSAKKIREIRDWRKQYDDEARDCIGRTGVKNAEEALMRVYPHLFGWKDGQIQPGEIKVGGKWEGKEGERLFSLKFAKSLHTAFEKLKEKGVDGFKNHGVRFDPENTPPIYLPRDSYKKLRNFYIANNINWWDHYLYFNLVSGFLSVAGNQEKAFQLLFGKVNNKTGCFGESEIKLEDVKERIPTRTSIVIDLLGNLETIYEESQIKINGLFLDSSEVNYTGIQGSCLENLLNENPNEVSEKTLALYDAYLAAIMPSETKERDSKELDRYTALEKILVAKKETTGELILSDDRLKLLLRTLKENIIDNTNINAITKNTTKKLIERLLKIYKPFDTPRDVLISATETERRYGLKNNALSVLNFVLEQVFEAIAINELRHIKVYGKNTSNYERILSNIEQVEDVI